MNRFWKMKLPAFLLAMVMVIGMVPAAFAASADISYDVDADDKVTIDVDDFIDFFDDEIDDESLEYVRFSNVPAFDDLGRFYAYDEDDDKVYLDEDDLDDYYFYRRTRDMSDSSDLQLEGLTFEAYDDADSEDITIRFKCYGDESSPTSYGYMKISIDGGSGSTSGDIVLEVDADDEETLSAKAFKSYFDKKSDETFEYMYFYNIPSKLDNYGYFYSRNKNDKETSIDAEDLADAEFYYDSDDVTSSGEYTLTDLTFVAEEDADGKTVSLPFYVVGDEGDKIKGTLTIEIGSVKSSSSKGDIAYTAEPSKEVEFDEEDFYDFLDDNYSKDLKYVVFTDASDLRSTTGYVYYRYGTRSEVEFDDDLEDYYFYYDDEDNVPSKANEDDIYPLDDLSFVASKSFSGSVTLKFRAYYSTTTTSSYKEGTLVISSGKGGTSSTGTGDINFKLKPGAEVKFDPDDFNDVFQEKYKSYDFEYLVFTDSENLISYNGDLYYDYGRSSSMYFTASSLDDYKFYYDEDDISRSDKYAYPLEDISFVAASTFLSPVTLEFRAYYSSSKYVDGTVVITPESTTITTSGVSGDILYQITSTSKLQLKANDFARFLRSKYPSSTLQYVKLVGVPSQGGLYYNYYGASQYGTAARQQLTAINCSKSGLYLSPSSTAQYALSELTYVPSGTNYCASIPFTAYGSNYETVTGSVVISVTSKTVPEVYGVITKGTSTSFPAPQLASAVSGSIGSFYGIQLLSLPSTTQGTVYVGTGNTRKADTATVYGYSSGTWTISQLRFVPAAGCTGNVEIPYAVCDSNGKALGVGKFCLGVVNSQKKFSDVTSSTWCYKYVAELSDAGVIAGYSNGTFKPDSTISYGAALKLIMRAAGYPELAPTVKNSPFSGYLARARAVGIITNSNVNLSKPITRLQVAQLAAGALKLDTSKVSSLKPFTDTTDASVQALNEAGIVEGYFSNGTSTYKPNNTLTRGQVSAIVWRMQQYRK